MGRRLSASEETTLLADTIRAAHEATQALSAAIREARSLTPRLVDELETVHRTEIRMLSNHMTAESNRAAEQLNQEVANAQNVILAALHTAHLDLDPQNGIITIQYPDTTFIADQPLPYPDLDPSGDKS